MKKNFLFRLLCVTLLAGMVFVSCKRENVTTGKYTVTVASANEEYVLGNKLPLWLFGFLY